MNFDRIARDILLEGLEDYVGLWQAAMSSASKFPKANWVQRMRRSLSSVETLTRAELVKIGDLAPAGGFAPWPQTIEEQLDRIRSEWRRLRRDPNLEDNVCWLRLTERGERAGRILLDSAET